MIIKLQIIFISLGHYPKIIAFIVVSEHHVTGQVPGKSSASADYSLHQETRVCSITAP